MGTNKTKKREKTGGRKRAEVVYTFIKSRDEYLSFSPERLYLNNGKKAPIVRWGSFYIYDNNKGSGGAYRLQEIKKQRGGWRLFSGSAYDQLARLATQYDKNYIKSRKIIVENWNETVDYYARKGWTDIRKTLAQLAVNGQEIHLMNMDNTELELLRKEILALV